MTAIVRFEPKERRRGERRRLVRRASDETLIPGGKTLLKELRLMIEAAREQTAQAINTALVRLYWAIGQRVRSEILKKQRAQYGEQIVSAVGRQLNREYGSGFSEKTLRHMIRFSEVFPDAQIVSALGRQLGWTHFRQIIYMDDQLKRDFYAEMCRVERWSTRTLAEKISGMLYERTCLSRKPVELARKELQLLRDKDAMTPDMVFRDPYHLDFLKLKNVFSEKDLETAILLEIERFLLELGTDFSFVARQKRLPIGAKDYYVDLLFFNRRLRALVAIELKLGNFQAADVGQMELYLRWLDKHERRPDENRPLGIILCSGKDHEEVTLLELNSKSIHVADYLTALPTRRQLKRKLREAIVFAREAANRKLEG